MKQGTEGQRAKREKKIKRKHNLMQRAQSLILTITKPINKYSKFNLKIKSDRAKPDVGAHPYLYTLEADRQSLQAPGQPQLHSETLLKKSSKSHPQKVGGLSFAVSS